MSLFLPPRGEAAHLRTRDEPKSSSIDFYMRRRHYAVGILMAIGGGAIEELP